MRLIDADALDYTRIQIFYGLHEDGKPLVGGYNAVVMSSAIRNAPTIDAVPVIRCRDCISFLRYELFKDSYCSHCGQKIDWSDYNEETD